MRDRSRAGMLVVLGLAACVGEHDQSRNRDDGPVADLRADANRDGDVRFDESDESSVEWNAARGAIFLANIDDDQKRCGVTGGDLALASCNDAEDEIVNGDEDALDLATLRVRPSPQPEDAIGRIDVATPEARPFVRLFKKIGPLPTDLQVVRTGDVLSKSELESGVELAIEAKDIVRDRDVWDGYVDVRLSVSSATAGAKTSTVRLRVAPVITFHHLLPIETVWVPNALSEGRKDMQRDLGSACEAAGLERPHSLDVVDQWAQDYFEAAFMMMPGREGKPHVVSVNYRSANILSRGNNQTGLRQAGRIVFALRGQDVAGVQQFDVGHDLEMDSLNSLGNFETIPPYDKDGTRFPLGRLLRGATKSFYPDRTFSRMLDAQAQQPVIEIDTSWLFVGHVDETMTFVRAPTERGWMVVANDPRLGRAMIEAALERGHGDVPMFVDKSWLDDKGARPAKTTVREVLNDTIVMQATSEAAVEIDAQLDVLKSEVGLRDDEILRVPSIYDVYAGRLVAYQPSMVNGVYLAQDLFASPDPHGPVIDGRDLFKGAMQGALDRIGIRVSWVEDWDAYHRALGEVHCGSNVARTIPDVRWWETGR